MSTRGRLTTIQELFRFQGLSHKQLDFKSLAVSERQMGGILGNTMSLPVCLVAFCSNCCMCQA